MTDGVHTVEARATDAAYNTVEAFYYAEQTFTVDTNWANSLGEANVVKHFWAQAFWI